MNFTKMENEGSIISVNLKYVIELDISEENQIAFLITGECRNLYYMRYKQQ